MSSGDQIFERTSQQNPLPEHNRRPTEPPTMLLSCQTCEQTLEDQEMLRHLSATRHKTVVHVDSSETLECEQCQDTNIHTLVIVRYGGQDMAMLCSMCFAKESEKPGTQYTLQNGSIFRNLPNYFKVRDLQCGLCDNTAHLSVDQKNPSFVACYKCIKEKSLAEKHSFVSENDENFLYVLLGIKEHVKTDQGKKFKRKRDAGRGAKGRGRKGKMLPKPVRIDVPSESKVTLRSFQALSKKDVVKVRPEDEKGMAPINNVAPVQSRGKPAKFEKKGKSASDKKPSKKAPPKKSNNNSKSPVTSGPRPSEADHKSALAGVIEALKKARVSDSPSPGSQTPQEKPVNGGEKAPKENKLESKFKDSKKAETKPKAVKKEETKPAKNGAKKDVKNDIKKESNTEKKNFKKDVKSEKKEKDTKKDKKADKKADKKPEKKSDKKEKTPKAKPDPKSQKTDTKAESPAPAKKEKPMLKVPDLPEDDHEEFEHIPKYLANQPKLSYDSLNDYFKEMCFHLYLEQSLEVSPITNFTTEFHAQDKSLFKLTLPYTEELEKLVPPKMRQLGKLPFSINQTIFVARSNDKDNIWDCFVKDLNLTTRGGKKMELLLELYKWNNASQFPVGSTTLSIVPGSPTISRILFAMARIENPKFIKMLQGKETIKQLNFNNRLTFTRPTFNDSQKAAIQHVLNNAITVLQGPPGTGKTSTIYEIILQLLRNLRTFPILVVAQSNVAIDNIAEKLKQDKDLTILRIVSTEKEREYNEKHHLADICLHHQVHERLPQRFKDTLLDLKYNRQPVGKMAYKKMLTVSNTITEKLIAQAQVIFTTTVVAGGYQLKSIKKLPVVIMDESTQSSEASTLIPLSMPGVDRFIFVGDDKQLSSFSEVPYLEQSLFERVLKNDTYKDPHMLNVQYRMHPAISEFPIKEFYDNKLSDGVTAEDRFYPGVDPLVFIDCASPESKVSNWQRNRGGGYTYTNVGEAKLILKVLKQLIFTKNVERREISVITPYSAQRDLIASVIQKDELINPNQEAIEEEVDEDSLTNKKPTTIKTVVGIMVSSIDAFQGREKDFILFSCVRSNKENNIGFVRDRRRLNVALTRARMGLVLVGDKECMSKGDKLWARLMTHLEEKKCITTESEYLS